MCMVTNRAIENDSAGGCWTTPRLCIHCGAYVKSSHRTSELANCLQTRDTPRAAKIRELMITSL
mgnify:CR=1 FL=1